MSGGAWGYLQHNVLDTSQCTLDTAYMCVEAMAILERCLDWGKSGDTCYDDAKEETLAGLEAFFSMLAEAGWGRVADVMQKAMSDKYREIKERRAV
jgi:hypothetical protein